ncbi:MAG: hypothetical protein IT261_06020 [Saprospiraceae bacterium]|nr:hypothetical protein [Saprospiraceae bacterium]
MQKLLLTLLACACLHHWAMAQCSPQILNAQTPVQGCDLSTNNAGFWNEIYWWEPQLQTHDLPETAMDLELILRDTCPDTLQVRCLLFLDLNYDGIQETVVDSDQFPNPNVVNYNNAFNPNYSGGTPRGFDQRPVPVNQKYRFALRTTTIGDSSHYSLQWSQADAPDQYTLPELPYGDHKIRWEVSFGSGQTLIQEKNIQINDCKKPVVVCLNGLSVNILPTELITLWASDFLQYMEDNTTTANLLKTGIRKAGNGTGFPQDNMGNPLTSVTYGCNELGEQPIELWSMDIAGNADFCQTNVIVMDNLEACNPSKFLPVACVETFCGDRPEEVQFTFDFPPSPFFPPFSLFVLGDESGCAKLDQGVPIAFSDVILTPTKDDQPLEEISSFDMVILQKHIDGVDLLDNPYQWIAADANKDNVLDSLDIQECTKLLLGIYTELPNNSSWRFVDKSYVFPTPDPLSAPVPGSIVINSNNIPTTPLEFIAVKICDLSCGNLVGFYDQMPENQHLIGEAQPNPTHEGALVPIQLIRPEKILLEVLDASGRLIFQRETAWPQGPAALEIPAEAMPQAGLYLWHVRAGNTYKSGKLVRQ